MKNKENLFKFIFINIILLVILKVITFIISIILPRFTLMNVFLKALQFISIINIVLSICFVVLSIGLTITIYLSNGSRGNKILSTINSIFIILIQVIKYGSNIYIRYILDKNLSLPSFINIPTNEFIPIYLYIVNRITAVLFITVIIIYTFIYFRKTKQTNS